jgi:hypothetical protein
MLLKPHPTDVKHCSAVFDGFSIHSHIQVVEYEEIQIKRKKPLVER